MSNNPERIENLETVGIVDKFYDPREYNFMLKEVCNVKTLQACLSSGLLDKEIKSSFKKYVNKHLKNVINDELSYVYVNYTTNVFEKESIGRMYPVISTDGVKPEPNKSRRCMTFSNNMPKTIRSTLCYELYHDIDFVNSQPTLLLQLFQSHNIESKYLKRYIEKREEILEEVTEWYNVERSFAKLLFLQIIYGGTIESWKRDNIIESVDNYPFAEKFQREMYNSCKKLLGTGKYDRYIRYTRYKKGIYNPFSAISYLLMTIENDCLVNLYKHYKKLDYEIGSFEFDGLKIIKKEKEFPVTHLISGEKYVRKYTGYNIKLTEKYIDPNESILHQDVNFVKGDIEAARFAIDKMKGLLIYSRKDSVLYYKKNNVWNILKSHKELNSFVSEFIFIKVEDSKRTVLTDSNRTVDSITKSMTEEIIKFDSHCFDDFEKVIADSTLGKICYKNGVYDMKKYRFIPWEEADNVYTTIIVNRNYSSEIDDDKYRYTLDILHEQFGKENFQDFIVVIARAIAGHARDKRWFTLFGTRNSGKGLFCHLLESAFGNQYIYTTNVSNFVCKKAGSDSSKDNGWLIPLRSARLTITNEVDPSQVLSGTVIKNFASGEDTINARELYSKPITFKNRSTLMICCNDIAKVEPADANENRIAVDMPFSYVSQEKIDSATQQQKRFLRIAIPDIKEKLNDDGYIDAFTQIIFENYKPYKTESLAHLDKKAEEFLDYNDDTKERILNYFVFTDNEKSRIPNRELFSVFKTIRDDLQIKDSNQKLKKLLKNNGADEYKSGEKGMCYIEIKDLSQDD